MPDYMYQLESRLSPEQRAVMMRVQELGQELQLNVYLTGGAVRDLISGMPIRDLDFTIEGNPVRMVRELEKGGARVIQQDEDMRHWELIFVGGADGSIEAAREDIYPSPGEKREIRWSGITDDLRRRDFSVNAIAISLNLASRGLLLDPMNGLADLELKEIRALSIHSFTNQPARLLRAIFYCARLGMKLEQRTSEWFDLAISRGLQESIDGESAGVLVRHLAREENPGAILKAWEGRKLLAAVHPTLARRKPNLDDFARLARAREIMWNAGLRPRLFPAVTGYLVDRFSPREQTSAMKHWGFSAAEMDSVQELPGEAAKLKKLLQSRKMQAPESSYKLLSQTPAAVLAHVLTEWSTSGSAMRIRNYLTKWHPLRLNLPVGELASLGVPSGPKFDEVMEKFFVMQLRGRARNPEEFRKILKKLAGIKDEPPKKVKPEKGRRKEKGSIPPQQPLLAKITAGPQPKPAPAEGERAHPAARKPKPSKRPRRSAKKSAAAGKRKKKARREKPKVPKPRRKIAKPRRKNRKPRRKGAKRR